MTTVRYRSKTRLLKAVSPLSTVLFFALLFASCEREEEALPEPVAALIRSQTSCICEPFVDQYLWKEKTVYLSSCRGPACNCIVSYYDDKGAPFQLAPGDSFDQFIRSAKFVRTVWRCGE